MKKVFLYIFLYISIISVKSQNVEIVAHRGASGYLPEHSLESKVLAYGMGVDYIEQDLVLTKDEELAVLHDLYLDRVTDVASKFPGREREDGHFYAIDFTMDEIRSLNLHSPVLVEKNDSFPEYPERFPVNWSSFRIHSFEEEIELIMGLNQTMKKDVGLFIEIKAPWFHAREGKDISGKVLNVLKKYGLESNEDKVFIQSFDPNELQRIRKYLFPKLGMELKLAQIIADTKWKETYELNKKGKWVPYDYDWMFKKDGMRKIARYADAVAAEKDMVINPNSKPDNIKVENLASFAENEDLPLYVYTLRADEGQVPEYAGSFEDLVKTFVENAKIDGLFTDFPDKAINALEK